MKYVFIFVIVIIITSFSAPSKCCIQTFIGVLGKNNDVRMKVEQQGNELLGFIKHQDKISWMKGSVDNTQHVMIDVSGGVNTLSGVLQGKFETPTIMKGVWTPRNNQESSPFYLERKAFIERSGRTSKGTAFKVIRVPETAGDILKIVIQDEEELLIPEWCYSGFFYSESGINIDSIHVSHLEGNPNLIQVSWSTYPEGMGDYEFFYYLLFPQGHANTLLLKNYIGNGKAGGNWGRGTYSLEYHDKTLIILEHYHYGDLSGNKEIVGESKVYRTYTVTTDTLTLINAEEYQRETENPDVDLKTVNWTKTKIPLNEAIEKYPVIQNEIP